jgi:hypothetical protein
LVWQPTTYRYGGAVPNSWIRVGGIRTQPVMVIPDRLTGAHKGDQAGLSRSPALGTKVDPPNGLDAEFRIAALRD